MFFCETGQIAQWNVTTTTKTKRCFKHVLIWMLWNQLSKVKTDKSNRIGFNSQQIKNMLKTVSA